MPRPIAYPVEVVGVAAHLGKDSAQHVEVISLAISADEVCLANAPAREYRPHRARMVFGMNPVAHIAPIAIQLRTYATEDVRNLAWNKLFDVLTRAIIIGAVTDRNRDTVGTVPCSDEQIA